MVKARWPPPRPGAPPGLGSLPPPGLARGGWAPRVGEGRARSPGGPPPSPPASSGGDPAGGDPGPRPCFQLDSTSESRLRSPVARPRPSRTHGPGRAPPSETQAWSLFPPA
ncbi:unnamed protein product [Rangifer tarandus platyrhynchus]|uniref:Basic proline-rich protein-like n=1 Tax=Rangifer tarandus platyrhynchus TaxID=3082113 RepID=A0ABN8Z0D6_RANTA|nr:unnamed protein product [Rangifer tarandus platyrhynchus]